MRLTTTLAAPLSLGIPTSSLTYSLHFLKLRKFMNHYRRHSTISAPLRFGKRSPELVYQGTSSLPVGSPSKISTMYGEKKNTELALGKRSSSAKREYVRCLLKERNLNLCRQRHLALWQGSRQGGPQTFRQKQFVRFG